MDKAEQVLALLRVGPLREWATTDERLDEIAAIFRREYGAAREKTLEEAAMRFERLIETLQLPETPQYDGDDRHIERRVITALAKAIRAMSTSAEEIGGP